VPVTPLPLPLLNTLLLFSAPVYDSVLRRHLRSEGFLQPFYLLRYQMPACVLSSPSHSSPDFPTCTLNSCTSHDPPGRRESTLSVYLPFWFLLYTSSGIQYLDFNSMSKSACARSFTLIVRLCLLNRVIHRITNLLNQEHLEFGALFQNRSSVRSHTPRTGSSGYFGVLPGHEILYSYYRRCAFVSEYCET
jgi:hypothetical protein